ncbi:MAG: MgtC/SapB family protein [Pseudomonadota bacterium]
MDALQGPELQHLPAFLTSLAVGLLIGLERERSPAAKAGLRTFALVALFGTLAAMLSETTNSAWISPVGLLLVGAMMIAAYARRDSEESGDPGTTTVAAVVVCYGLGTIIWYGYTTLAVMLAIATTMLLYFKTELRGLTQSLTRRDFISTLQFAVLTFIILPILPDRAYGPYGALNPHQIWLMVVLISGVSLTGYVALRITGQRHGAPLLGLFGGLVSSTATTLVYARHGKGDTSLRQLAVIVILLANLVVLVRLALLGAAVSPKVLPQLLAMLGSGLAFGLAGSLYWWRKLQQQGEVPMPEIKNPTEIRISLSFGLLYATVLFCAAWLSDIAGSPGLYTVALISGLTDVDAITLSSLHLFELGKLQAWQATTAIGLALLSNIAFKLGLVLFIAGRELAWRCTSGMFGTAIGISAALYLGNL